MICGNKDHKAASCPSVRPKSGACFNCGRQSHKAASCPSARPISSIFACALFDTSASHSFVSPSFASQLGIIIEPLDVELLIDTPTGGEMVTNSVCKSCIVIIENRVLPTNLIVLDMHDFDVILGMDWLVKHYTNLDFRRKRIDFQILGDQEFSFIGSSSRTPPKIISVL